MVERETALGQGNQNGRQSHHEIRINKGQGNRIGEQHLNGRQNADFSFDGGDNENGGEWQEVVRKKKKKLMQGSGRADVATAARFHFNDTFSFYFTEFPETHGANEMLKAFRFYGEAVEVVIPPKRDKWGKRFGFVRFKNIDDPRVAAIRLDNIIFGATKIHVNIPKFQREMPGKLTHNDQYHGPRTVEKRRVE